MEDYMRDTALGRAPRLDYGDSRKIGDLDSVLKDSKLNSTQVTDPMFDFNVQYSREPIVSSNDPFYETFDFLGSPNSNNISPAGANDVIGDNNFSRTEASEPLGFGVPAPDHLNVLDPFILPFTESDAFASSQYFSPNTRGNQFLLLNPIAENTFSELHHEEAFSPELQPSGISIPNTLHLNLYLSPNAFVSPRFNTYEGSYDTLASPYSSAYLNSPPPMNLNQSSSIPNTKTFALASLSRALSQLPNQKALGVSAPTSTSVPSQRKPADVVIGSEFTQEEKAKRRRKFHNAVERRRRDLIKEKIKILGMLVPPSLLTPQEYAIQMLLKLSQSLSVELKELIDAAKVKEVKPNKSIVLQTSVEYIRHLHSVIERQKARCQEIEATIASYEDGSDKYTYSSADNFPEVNASLHTQLTGEFNPDEFFSDVISDAT
ncbi:hypothetical protein METBISCDRAFT_21942 [Metschnikowia bicuspidata]|uniref:BHLH domain-containing protein n=1 Tax=Metschnikowia bicuspidata TaxID=27322 RepID=A0A4P9ZIH5_9ASCO|nr:hypothetical protein METBISCDRAFT_21942 [Metschnikowia bicuspidata]